MYGELGVKKKKKVSGFNEFQKIYWENLQEEGLFKNIQHKLNNNK